MRWRMYLYNDLAKCILGVFLFLSYDQIRNPCENLHQMSQSGLGIKQYLGPKSWLEIWVFGIFDLTKRLFGVGVIWTKDSLVLTQPWHQGALGPFAVAKKNPKLHLGRSTEIIQRSAITNPPPPLTSCSSYLECVWNDGDAHVDEVWRGNFEHLLGELLPVLVDLLENKKGKTLVSTSKSSLCVESIKIQSFEVV